jgi:hypothetical protein
MIVQNKAHLFGAETNITFFYKEDYEKMLALGVRKNKANFTSPGPLPLVKATGRPRRVGKSNPIAQNKANFFRARINVNVASLMTNVNIPRHRSRKKQSQSNPIYSKPR